MTPVVMQRISLAVAGAGLLLIVISHSMAETMANRPTARSMPGGGIHYSYDVAVIETKRENIKFNARIIGSIMLGTGLLRALQPSTSERGCAG